MTATESFPPGTKSPIEHLRLVLASGQIGLWELDLASGKAWRNLRHDQIFGYDSLLSEWTYEQFLGHVVEDDRQRIDALQSEAVTANKTWSFECRIIRADGERRWISATGEPLLDAEGRAFKLIGHVIDITHTKETEEQLRLVTGELNHRVRNFSMLVLSILNHSARSAKSVADLTERVKGRIGALAMAQAIYAGDTDQPVAAKAVIRDALSPFDIYSPRLAVDVDDAVRLDGKTAQNFALVFHELITNAIKHGALASETGELAIRLVARNAGRARFEWIENGDRPVTPPVRQGFGSTLITSALGASAEVNLDYRPNGLTCSIDLDVVEPRE